MSTLRVEVVQVGKIEAHPNADRLEIAAVKGWQSVVQRGKHYEGQLVVFFPVDSVLPPEIDKKIFPGEAGSPLKAGRVRTVKLRKAISQGIVATFEDLGVNPAPEGTDLTEFLGVKKYDPDPDVPAGYGQRQPAAKKDCNPNFQKYTDIENIKNYVNVFSPGECVVVTEKIHGSNFRAGYVPTAPKTLWGKLKRFLRLAPQHEFVFGSRKEQLKNSMLLDYTNTGNAFADVTSDNGLKDKLRPGEVIYGEVYGWKIQKNYSYGCRPGERKLVVFDVQQDGRYLDSQDAYRRCLELGLNFVPILYVGPFDMELIRSMTEGDSILAPSQKVREGVVVKPVHERRAHMGRVVLKMISVEYDLGDQSGGH